MYYRQPRYFGDFKCIGGTCSNSCCIGWRIDWTKEEIDKITDAPECSEELKELVNRSFIELKDQDKYIVILDAGNRCPFLTEDNFCKIQRGLGAEYLSYTCSIYPRHYIIAGEAAYRYCNMSCPEVMNKLLNSEKSMDMVNAAIRKEETVQGAVKNTEELLEEHPELKYRGELLEFFYEIIADKKHDVETSIILGALAAQSLSKVVAAKDHDGIPEAIKQIRPQLHNGAQLRSIENIKPNYYVKLGAAGEILQSIFTVNTMAALSDKEGKPNIDLYIRGEKRLADTFRDRQFYLRNIALKLLLEFCLPFKFPDKTIFENYSIFAAAFALFKLNVIATAELTDRAEQNGIGPNAAIVSSTINVKVKFSLDTEKYVGKSAAMISRNLCHNDDNAKKLLEELQNRKLSTPAYLALLIK